ncbi:hypothetical protein AS034_13365 [[Bacillus] enclensis]|uniref:Uncharacterized protein n=1 Tax=[Bacillus] enclensis TaxID=1402860 RepID=A0A0V8HHJ4_9BACI|nr:hypothetical protein [[Bacillus] enclensis]KSU61815.1 hypothetical protein AS034_13365 [[Bacillus] enclensis]SCC15690.1 hypothetical protein GA0061094_2765 [[Bacillus] enclensis]
MVKNKFALIGSFVLLAIPMILFFPFPDNDEYMTRSEFMGLPIETWDGYVPLGVAGSVLFIAAMILLVIGLEKYRVRGVLIGSFGFVLLPYILFWLYQETFAQGIYAVSYDGEGSCVFERAAEEEMLNGECKLNLHNHSGEETTVEVEFIDTYIPGEESRMESLMNVNGPYVITLGANEKRSLKLEELLDVSPLSKTIDGGSFSNVQVRLKDGEESRIL